MCHIHKPIDRREFLTRTSLGLGAVSLASLLNPTSLLAGTMTDGIRGTHFAPRAKRVIYLYQAGAPSQLDLFDYKPLLIKRNEEEMPSSILGRVTGITESQSSLRIVGTRWDFKRHGQSGMYMSELMPHMSQLADELCMINSMYTESVQHEPAMMFNNTGSELPGRPSFGSWISYGLGSDNENLPSFIVLKTPGREGGFAGTYSNAFLSAEHQGVRLRSGKNPVLYLNNPKGVSEELRRDQLDYLGKLQSNAYEAWEDPDIKAKMAQYEMAFRMQTSVPEAVSVDKEPDYIHELYGPESKKPGTFAANCLLARRLAERDVKFIQIYHGGWDHHSSLPRSIAKMTKETDQASAALLTDLKQRGMLEDTLVIWGGEFGRTSFSEGQITKETFGRDHNPQSYTVLLAGAGVKKGLVYGKTDDFGYRVVENPVHVHDLNATLLHLLGLDHEKLTYKFKGRRYRLTDVHGKVVRDIIS